MPNSRIGYYVTLFKENYQGDPWLGESFEVKLKDVNNSNAFHRPGKDIHSIGEIVAHIIYWRDSLLKHLEGDRGYKGSVKNSDNWPSPEQLEKEGWASLHKRLETSQKKIVSLLAKQPDSFLSEEYSAGASYAYLIQGIIDHDIYHLGQIGLVKKMLSVI